MANSYLPQEQKQAARNIIRCPYCVDDGNFKAMIAPESGEGHICTSCGHVVLPSNPQFECICDKCARFKISMKCLHLLLSRRVSSDVRRAVRPGSPICPRCTKPVRLEDTKTDEDGRAMYEDCYCANLKGTTPSPGRQNLLPNLDPQFARSIRGNPNLRQLSNHCVRVPQSVCPIGTRNPQHLHATRESRLNPSRRVFNDQTFRSAISQPRRPLQIWLRMRLPVSDIVGGNQNFGHGQSTVPQPTLRQQPRPRRDNTPPSFRNR